MLANLNDVLPDAQKGHYAVGRFNTVDSQMLSAIKLRHVKTAAEEKMRLFGFAGKA